MKKEKKLALRSRLKPEALILGQNRTWVNEYGGFGA
jgi:hypothetical protein